MTPPISCESRVPYLDSLAKLLKPGWGTPNMARVILGALSGGPPEKCYLMGIYGDIMGYNGIDIF